jgi:t-SNARE complex subunit (syntaxin)
MLGKVEANRAAHPGMTDAEVERRRKTVSDLESDINGIAKTLESREAKDKRAKDRDRADRARRDRAREAEAAAASASARGHADRMTQQQMLQQREESKQDEHLMRLEEGLDVAGQKAHLMRRELDEQDGLIDDMGKEMSTAQTGLDAATDRIQKLLQTKDNRIICLVLVLIITLVVLCIFAFN